MHANGKPCFVGKTCSLPDPNVHPIQSNPTPADFVFLPKKTFSDRRLWHPTAFAVTDGCNHHDANDDA
jgi:hypothetical protein